MSVHEELRKLCDEHFSPHLPIIAQIGTRAGGGTSSVEMNIRMWLPEDWTYEPAAATTKISHDIKELIAVARKLLAWVAIRCEPDCGICQQDRNAIDRCEANLMKNLGVVQPACK